MSLAIRLSRFRSIVVSGVAVLSLSAAAFAFQAASSSPAADPVFTAAPASLTPQQVARLQQLGSDYGQLARYRQENSQLPAPPSPNDRVVFFGDSITDNWGRYVAAAKFFPGKPYLNRGVSGETTGQMLIRFEQDVVALKPAVVVILAGTNDIAGNTGLSTLFMTEDNLRSMDAIAKANGIRVVLASVLPATAYPWRAGVYPAETIRQLNAWLRDYAAAQGDTYLDYYAAMSNAQGGLDANLASDGVHPTAAGYAVMAPLAEKAIADTMRR